MIENITVVDDGDLVSHAERHMNIDWNKACGMVRPLMTNSHIDERDVGENDEYGYGEDCCKIVRSFMKTYGIDEIYYVGHV